MVSPYDLDVPGGVQAHVRALADVLRRDGDEVVLIGPGRVASGAGRAASGDATPGGAASGDAAANDADAGPVQHDAAADTVARGGLPEELRVGGATAVPFNGSRAPIALSPLVARRTRAALVRCAPDVVHVHEPLVPMVGLAAATSGVAPTVATFHAWSTRDTAYRAARPLARRVLRGLDAAIAVSDAAAGYHAGALNVPSRTFRIVPNGVDVDRFAQAAAFPDVVADPAPRLLFVGRLEPRKGLEAMVRAFTLLKADHPDVRLYVVGDGGERERCQALLPSRLREDVVFLGRVDHDDLPRWYASCDVYVSPALGGESFGIVLLEAMAAGRPVVASDIPGYRSVATDGVQARLVPTGDPRALADALGGLIANPSLRAAMGQQGRDHARRYDWPVVAAQVRSVYEDLLAR